MVRISNGRISNGWDQNYSCYKVMQVFMVTGIFWANMTRFDIRFEVEYFDLESSLFCFVYYLT